MSSQGKGPPMSPRFEGRVAIVTGSGGGIGEAYARALHAEGARVVIAELDAARGQAVADDLGEGALFVPTDVGDPASTDAMATATVDAFGRIDHLVNNAAIFGDMELAGLTTVDYDYLDRFLQVNMLGALHCTRSTMGPMGEVGGGSIVNQSSTASWMGIAGFYGLAKAGLNFLTSSLAHELGWHNIRVNAIAPGRFETKMTEYAMEDATAYAAELRSIPLHRWGQDPDIMGTALLLASRAGAFITGQVIAIDGGTTLV